MVDLNSFHHTSASLVAFYHALQLVMTHLLHHSQVTSFATLLWKFFVAIQLIWFAAAYASGSSSLAGVLHFLILAMLTKCLMLQYDNITGLLWGCSESLASQVQNALPMEQDNLFSLSHTIWQYSQSLVFSCTTWFNPTKIISHIVLSLTVNLLSLLACFATAWALWGYALCKMIGLIFLPCLLSERLSWLFDGWMKLFFGFLLYNIFARVNLVLVVIALKSYFHSGIDNTIAPQYLHVDNLGDGFGLLCFLLLCIAALLSTGKFVRIVLTGCHYNINHSIRTICTNGSTEVARSRMNTL